MDLKKEIEIRSNIRTIGFVAIIIAVVVSLYSLYGLVSFFTFLHYSSGSGDSTYSPFINDFINTYDGFMFTYFIVFVMEILTIVIARSFMNYQEWAYLSFLVILLIVGMSQLVWTGVSIIDFYQMTPTIQNGYRITLIFQCTGMLLLAWACTRVFLLLIKRPYKSLFIG